ncbi:uncharacterized protein VICG_01720 [Vittaforma corneae ATCC 50505]|uniref:Uncharacterized protein n=1 Tax=Vittaforma corneae (strain ATCC 50505) TaxID=993615 RepID=L2GK57_VITCO|nr:uncharacterized protein VICG_01720 [Vittaforma corneae ATCC 50505]ELA41231.1 hypothetical protein VICG_01720 [Vittaforma corneae ATCC 50505]
MLCFYTTVKCSLFMQLGWRIFMYKKQIRNENDAYSYCKTRLREYSERLFIDDTSSNSENDYGEMHGYNNVDSHGKAYGNGHNKVECVSIFTSPSKTIELLIIHDWIEIRLFEWGEKGTGLIILEKTGVKEVKCKTDGGEKTVSFILYKNSCVTSQFKVVFYKEENKRVFLEYLASRVKGTNLESNSLKDLPLKSFMDHISVVQFVSRMSEMSGDKKNDIKCTSIEDFVKEMNVLSGA